MGTMSNEYQFERYRLVSYDVQGQPTACKSMAFGRRALSLTIGWVDMFGMLGDKRTGVWERAVLHWSVLLWRESEKMRSVYGTPSIVWVKSHETICKESIYDSNPSWLPEVHGQHWKAGILMTSDSLVLQYFPIILLFAVCPLPAEDIWH